MANGNGMLRVLRENWFLIVAIVSIITSWVVIGQDVKGNKEDILKYCTKIEKVEEDMHKYENEMTGIKIDIEYIKKGIDRNYKILEELRQ